MKKYILLIFLFTFSFTLFAQPKMISMSIGKSLHFITPETKKELLLPVFDDLLLQKRKDIYSNSTINNQEESKLPLSTNFLTEFIFEGYNSGSGININYTGYIEMFSILEHRLLYSDTTVTFFDSQEPDAILKDRTYKAELFSDMHLSGIIMGPGVKLQMFFNRNLLAIGLRTGLAIVSGGIDYSLKTPMTEFSPLSGVQARQITAMTLRSIEPSPGIAASSDLSWHYEIIKNHFFGIILSGTALYTNLNLSDKSQWQEIKQENATTITSYHFDDFQKRKSAEYLSFSSSILLSYIYRINP